MFSKAFFLYLLLSLSGLFSYPLPPNTSLSLNEWNACDQFIQTKAESFFSRGTFLIPANDELPCPVQKDPQTGHIYIHLKGRKGASIGIGSHKIVTKSILFKKKPCVVARCECDQPGTNEAEALLHTAHIQGIIHSYSFIQTSDHSCEFFLEYCSCGSLSGIYAHDSTFSTTHVLVYMKDLLEALQGLHKQGYIHRDIKPGNIFFKHERNRIRAILGDLGLACETQKAFGRHIGVPNRTCSPEILVHANNELDPKMSETYSLGIVFYYMLFHRYPKYSNIQQREAREESQEKKLERYKLIQNGYENEMKERRLNGLKKEIFILIMKMLHPNPHYRIPLTSAIQEAQTVGRKWDIELK